MVRPLHSFDACHTFKHFTLENKFGHSIAFLNKRLTRSDASLKRSVYKKQIWDGQLNNFDSWLPISIERNLIHPLCYRIHRISNTECIDEELSFLRKTLAENSYPCHFTKNKTKKKSEQKVRQFRFKQIYLYEYRI